MTLLLTTHTQKEMANGKWQMANGKWQMANGKWQMANGKWQMADNGGAVNGITIICIRTHASYSPHRQTDSCVAILGGTVITTNLQNWRPEGEFEHFSFQKQHISSPDLQCKSHKTQSMDNLADSDDLTIYEMSANAWVRYFNRLQTMNLNGDVPMFARRKTDGGKGGKDPVYPHKNGQYDQKVFDLHSKLTGSDEEKTAVTEWLEACGHSNLNLLVENLYILDADDPDALEEVEKWAEEFPDDFGNCPMQKTRKGQHWWFLRWPSCSQVNKAKAFKAGDGNTVLNLDLLTISGTGTRGNVNVWPSAGKMWVQDRGLFDLEPRVPSLGLQKRLEERYIQPRSGGRHPPASNVRNNDNNNNNRVSGRNARSQATRVPRQQGEITQRQKIVTEAILKEHGGTVVEGQLRWETGDTLRIVTSWHPEGQARRCMSDSTKTHTSNCAIINILQNGSISHFCFGCKTSKVLSYPALALQADATNHTGAAAESSPPAIGGVSENSGVACMVAEAAEHVVRQKAQEQRNKSESRRISDNHRKLMDPPIRALLCPHNRFLWKPRDLAEFIETYVLGEGHAVRDGETSEVWLFTPELHRFEGMGGSSSGARDNMDTRCVDGLLELLWSAHASAEMAQNDTAKEAHQAGLEGILEALVKDKSKDANTSKRDIKKCLKDLGECKSGGGLTDPCQLMETIIQLKDFLWTKIANHLFPKLTQPRVNFDTDPHTMGAENGVIHLLSEDQPLQPGRPSDKITKSVEFDYIPGPPSDTFLRVIEQIYPIPEEREFIRKLWASLLYGRAPGRHLFLMTDAGEEEEEDTEGGNGKSAILKLLYSAMGGYAFVSDVRILSEGSRSKDASAHNATMANCKGKRLLAIDEGMDGAKLGSIFKGQTGGATKITARQCGKGLSRGDTFEQTHKILMSCNNKDLPNLGEKMGAVVNRVVAIYHRGKFVDDPEAFRALHPNHEYVHKADKSMFEQHGESFKSDVINWVRPVYRQLHERGNGVPCIIDSDIPSSFQQFKLDMVGKQTCPDEIMSEMRDYFQARYIPDDSTELQREWMDNGSYVKMTEFCKEFCSHSPGGADMKIAKECFKQLSPERYRGKGGAQDSNRNQKTRVLIGFKKLETDFYGRPVEQNVGSKRTREDSGGGESNKQSRSENSQGFTVPTQGRLDRANPNM